MNKQDPQSGEFSTMDTPMNIDPSKESGGPDVPKRANLVPTDISKNPLGYEVIQTGKQKEVKHTTGGKGQVS